METTFTHGGTGGTAASLTLGNSEYWVTAELCQGQKSGETRNFYILATTSTGKTLAAGTSTSDCATFWAPTGWQIVGLMGQDGDEMDQLAFIHAPQ
jgi:Jacalin-like lectin domain